MYSEYRAKKVFSTIVFTGQGLKLDSNLIKNEEYDILEPISMIQSVDAFSEMYLRCYIISGKKIAKQCLENLNINLSVKPRAM